MVATFLTGSILTLLLPVGLLIVVGVYWWMVTRRRDEF
jgi:cytochrome c-type biogenesis protein CcmH/NrfF